MASGRKTGGNADGQANLDRYEIATDEELENGKEMGGAQHEAVVVDIEQGLSGDFVRNPGKWDGDLDVKCLNVIVESENDISFRRS